MMMTTNDIHLHRHMPSGFFRKAIFLSEGGKKMSAEVETMFYTRTKPWHGLGTMVMEALDSGEALEKAGLDWNVVQKDIYTGGEKIEGFRANVRDSDNKVLGVVTDRYKVVQNWEAFAFTDTLLGKGIRYETAGALQGGRKIWILARLPHEYIITGERISPYMVFSNSHDGNSCIRVAMTPIRVVCSNTLNLALRTAQRSWAMKHTGNIENKLQEAEQTMFLSEKYMDALGKEITEMQMKKIPDRKVMEYIGTLLPVDEGMSEQQKKNMIRQQEEMKLRYFEAPDLQDTEKNAYRFINAVSDFATHTEPLRMTAGYRENLFMKTIDGNPMIDKAYQMISAA
jgi:phage/plasmid-like protein (TIGR03299 family)